LTFCCACFQLKNSREGIIESGNILTTEQPSVVEGNFAPSFSRKYLSFFEHISGAIDPITLIWVSLERSLPPAELEYR